jgi:hypothetical protein
MRNKTRDGYGERKRGRKGKKKVRGRRKERREEKKR